MDRSIDQKIRKSFAAQGLMTTVGARIDAISDGQVTLSAPISAAVSQQAGYVHAGLTFALGDSAAGYAALTVFPQDTEVVTTEMKINLLAPAEGDRMIAEGRVVRAGRRLTVVAADVFTERNSARTHVATLLGSMMPLRA